MSNRLPVENRDITLKISVMMVGEVRYVTPSAMKVNNVWSCYLNPEYLTSRAKSEIASLRIERRLDGYHVWLRKNHLYDDKDTIVTGDIAVKEIHTKELENGDPSSSQTQDSTTVVSPDISNRDPRRWNYGTPENDR